MSCSNKDCVFSYRSTGQFTAGSCNCLADLKISNLELMVLRKFLANGKRAICLLKEILPIEEQWPNDLEAWGAKVRTFLGKVE